MKHSRTMTSVRRLLCALLTVSLLLGASFATAEEFSLRSGIQFGDTIDTVVTKETTLERESDTSNWFKGTIAGYDNSECGFYFDDETGELYAMDYSFANFGSDFDARDSVDSTYSTLCDSLKRKYGTPLNNYGGKCHLITGPAFDRMALWVYLMGSLDGCKGDYLDYDEWIVDCDGYHVKVDLCSYYYRNSDYEYDYWVDVSYQKFTDADLDEALAEKKSENEAVDNDL